MVTVTTNNVPRDILDGWELTFEERKEFDFLDWPAIQEGSDSASFFRYKGDLYYLNDFMSSPIEGWDGYSPGTYFSGLVVKYPHLDNDPAMALDSERIIVGAYYVS